MTISLYLVNLSEIGLSMVILLLYSYLLGKNLKRNYPVIKSKVKGKKKKTKRDVRNVYLMMKTTLKSAEKIINRKVRFLFSCTNVFVYIFIQYQNITEKLYLFWIRRKNINMLVLLVLIILPQRRHLKKISAALRSL